MDKKMQYVMKRIYWLIFKTVKSMHRGLKSISKS